MDVGLTFDPTTRATRALFLVVRVAFAMAATLAGWAFLRLGVEVSTLLGALMAHVITAVEGLLHR